MGFCSEGAPELDKLYDTASQGQCRQGIDHYSGIQIVA